MGNVEFAEDFVGFLVGCRERNKYTIEAAMTNEPRGMNLLHIE
jgi:uncharacterized protein YcsI (UPF0317 family)